MLEVATVPISSLKPWPENSRRHDLAVITESLTQHGQIKPLVVQRSANKVLAGNGTLEAAIGLGWTEIDVTFMDVDDEQAAKINVIDNRSYDLGGYDEAKLLAQLGRMADLEGTGYDWVALDDIRAKFEEPIVLAAQPGEWGHATPNRGPGDDPHPGQASPTLREVLLMLTPEELDRFREATAFIRRELDLPSTSAAVMYAVEQTAETMRGQPLR